jgi:hypothetical protein
MKKYKMPPLRLLTILSTFTWVATGPAATNDPATDLRQTVAVELGDAHFAPGDSLTIQNVYGTSDLILTGGTYCVEGTYTLNSQDAAELALFTTGAADNRKTPVEPTQTQRITKGTGTFRLTTPLRTEGYLHVGFYPLTSGGSFGGIYFGQKPWVLHDGQYSQFPKSSGVRHPSDRSIPSGSQTPQAAPNQAMLEYLGDPVAAPAGLAADYTPKGLQQAVQAAARQAGVTVARIELENSEFPCVIGVNCDRTDYQKLMAQIKLMNAYEDQGSVGGRHWHTMNIVPPRVFPRESSTRIWRRLSLRYQMFYDQLTGGE